MQSRHSGFPTVVPDVSLVMSRVLPAGTAMFFRTMLEQAVLDALADAAFVKVQAVAAFTFFAGLGAGAAATRPMLAPARMAQTPKPCIFDKNGQ